jgi:hypothetical protein
MRAAALIACLAAVGCTSRTSNPLFAGSSPAPLHAQLVTQPAAGSDGRIVRSAILRVVLDDYPDPDDAQFGPVELRSGAGTFDLEVRADLVGHALVVTPRSLLSPEGNYELVVQAGIRSLSGRTLARTFVATIAVSGDPGPARPTPPAPTWTSDIRGALATCAPFCHSPIGASGDARTPTRMLDLTGDPLDPVFGLVRVPAVGELDSPEPLLRVAPGDSAHSVLLRKLIGGNPAADSHDPPYPNMGVDGRRMPIPLDESQPAGPFLSNDTLQLVEDWIDAGAPI